MGKSELIDDDNDPIVYALDHHGERAYCCPPVKRSTLSWVQEKYHGSFVYEDPIERYEWRKLMGDSLHLAGPDANMERETFLAEQERAEKMDKSKILELLSQTFCEDPAKTIEEMTPEEVLKHKYTLEETVRTLRVHLLVAARAEQKHRAEKGKKVMDGLDMTFKPKPVPASRQATNAYEKLVLELMEKKNLTREEAEEILK